MADDGGTSAQRIRIGLIGLSIAFILVMLGSAISRSREDGPVAANAVAQANDAEPNEPLAELGVAPGAAETAVNNTGE